MWKLMHKLRTHWVETVIKLSSLWVNYGTGNRFTYNDNQFFGCSWALMGTEETLTHRDGLLWQWCTHQERSQPLLELLYDEFTG